MRSGLEMEGQEIIKSDKTMKYAGVAGIVSIVLCILLSSARYFLFTLTPHPDNGYSLVLRFVSQLLSYVQFALLMLPWFFLALSKIKSSWLIWIHLGVSFLYFLAGSFVLSNILRAVAPENYTMVNAMSHSAMNLICTVLLAAVVAGLFIANNGWPRRVLLLLLVASVIGVFACVFHAISLFIMLGHRSSSFAFRIFSFLYEIGYIAASMIRLAGWMMLYFGPSRQAPNEEGGSAGFSDPHVALRWRLYIAAIPWLSALSAMQYGVVYGVACFYAPAGILGLIFSTAMPLALMVGVGYLLYILATTAIILSSRRNTLILTSVLMAILILLNFAGFARIVSLFR